MAELLIEILMLVVEIALEVGGEAFLDFLLRADAETIRRAAENHPIVCGIGYGAVGVAVGAATLGVYPHPIFHRSGIPGVSLLVAPIVTGWLMQMLGNEMRRSGKEPGPLESFRYGFVTALGMALVRFLFAA